MSSKKNSCRGNYMRKYGIYFPAIIFFLYKKKLGIYGILEIKPRILEFEI